MALVEVDEAAVTHLAAQWRAIAELNESQAARVREFQPPFDRWAPLAGMFSPGPVTPDIAAVMNLAKEGETWLDVGCGAGRFTAHLATKAGRVVATDSSGGMTDALREAAKERELDNVRVLPASPWPIADIGEEIDVAFSAHVVYFVTNIVPFVMGMEAHAKRRCVMLLADEAGALPPYDAWYAAHHEPMSRLPALAEFEALMKARGIDVERTDVEMSAMADADVSVDQVFKMLANRCLLRADSPKAGRLRKWFDEQREATGKLPPLAAMQKMALLSWEPPRE